jgi:hypothetical protein
LQYTSEKINAFLAEDGASVAEARPVAVTDLSGVRLYLVLTIVRLVLSHWLLHVIL